MAANKRTAGEIAHDRQVIAQLYLHGVSHADIAHQLNDLRDKRRAEMHLAPDFAAHITRQQITYDLDVLRKEWALRVGGDTDQKRGEELAKIDALEATYWSAWERSLQPKKTQSAQTGTSADPALAVQIKAGNIKTMIKTEERDGNAVYLAGVDRCIERRCKLLGLDAPQLIDAQLSGPDGAGGGLSIRWLTDDEAEEQAKLARAQKEHEQRLLGFSRTQEDSADDDAARTGEGETEAL